MKFNWYLPEGAKGELEWIGHPFRKSDGIWQVYTVLLCGGQHILSLQAWSVLPYLELGSVCAGSEPPQYKPDLEQHRIPLCKISSTTRPAMEVIAREQIPFTALTDRRIPFGHENCACFEYGGLRYVAPYFEVIRAVTGRMSVLSNGILHERRWEEWILDETQSGSSLELAFSSQLSLRFLQSPGVVEYLVWLRFTRELESWWNGVSVSFGKGRIDAPIPGLKSGALIAEGRRRGSIFLVYRMRIAEAVCPFETITWTHPQGIKKEAPEKGAAGRGHAAGGEPEDPVNQADAFADKQPPHMEYLQRFSASFQKKPLVRQERPEGGRKSPHVRRFGVEDPENSVTTNEQAVAGRVRPAETVPDTEPPADDTLDIRPAIRDFFDALRTIRCFSVQSVRYPEAGTLCLAVVQAQYGGRRVFLAEPQRDQFPCASTLLAAGQMPDDQALLAMLPAGNWKATALKTAAKQTPFSFLPLRHFASRPSARWGELIKEKIEKL